MNFCYHFSDAAESEAPNDSSSAATSDPSSVDSGPALRFVGCVVRRVSLPPHSQSKVPCQGLLTEAGTFTLGRVLLKVTTTEGVNFTRRVAINESVVVADLGYDFATA